MIVVKTSCLREPFLPRFVCKTQALKELVPCVLEGKKKANATEKKIEVKFQVTLVETKI